MKVRILDVFFLMMIVALIYAQVCESRQQSSNHFFLKGVVGRRWLEHTADVAEIEARLERIDPGGAGVSMRPIDKDYVCAKCGWKPRDDGPMNNKDTFEPLVAALRIDAHELDHVSP